MSEDISSNKHVLNYTTLKGHRDSVNCLDSSSKHDMLFSGSDDGSARIWDLKSSKCIRAIIPEVPDEPETSINCISSIDDHTVFISRGQTLLSYDIRNTDIILRKHQWIYKNNDEINQISINESKEHMLFCDDEGSIKVFDLSNMKILKTLQKHVNACISAKFRTKFKELLSGGFDCNILQWEYLKSRINAVYAYSDDSNSGTNVVNPPYIYTIDIRDDGNFATVGYGNGTIEIINLYSKERSCKIEFAHTNIVNQSIFPKFSPFNHMVSSGNDNMIKLWKLNFPTNEELKSYVSMKAEKQSLQYPPKKKLTKAMKKRIENLTNMMNNLSIECQYSLSAQIKHNQKINWITTTEQETSSGNLFVADISSQIGCYSIRV